MDLGVALPTSGSLASPANIVRIAREAERLGYAAVWTYERLLRPMAELPSPDGRMQRIPENYRLTYEPLETLSYVAAVTERVRLGTSVIDALLHPPVVLARRFATLDQLSGGRAIAGVGQGWMPRSSRPPTCPWTGSGPAWTRWSRPCAPAGGRTGRVPGPLVPDRPLGGEPQAGPGAPPGAARGDHPGRSPAGRADRRRHQPDRLLGRGGAGPGTIFRQAAEAAGRDPAALSVVVRANVPITREPLGDGRPFLGGSPRQIAEDVARLEPVGVDQVLFSSRDPRDLETEVGLLGELREAVA